MSLLVYVSNYRKGEILNIKYNKSFEMKPANAKFYKINPPIYRSHDKSNWRKFEETKPSSV